MFPRFRTALGLTLFLMLLTSVTVFAKGSFAFITIAGPDMKEPIRSTDPALTTDFFAFADFSRSAMKAPADLGVGYEIKRYYIDGGRESAFDHLHYYPETGYVFFDGLMGGSSEYDGKWYKANAGIKSVFEKALTGEAVAKSQPVEEVVKAQPEAPSAQTAPNTSTIQMQSVVAIITVVGVLSLLAFLLLRRRAFTQ